MLLNGKNCKHKSKPMSSGKESPRRKEHEVNQNNGQDEEGEEELKRQGDQD